MTTTDIQQGDLRGQYYLGVRKQNLLDKNGLGGESYQGGCWRCFTHPDPRWLRGTRWPVDSTEWSKLVPTTTTITQPKHHHHHHLHHLLPSLLPLSHLIINKML